MILHSKSYKNQSLKLSLENEDLFPLKISEIWGEVSTQTQGSKIIWKLSPSEKLVEEIIHTL